MGLKVQCLFCLCLDEIIKMSPKLEDPDEEKEMKIVAFIWSCMDKWNTRKVATNNGSTQGGSREGIVANEQTIAIEIE